MAPLHARFVWEDAQKSIDMMEVSEDRQVVRIMYAASITLLRTIGDVLDKVDKPALPKQAQAVISKQWEIIKCGRSGKRSIFWDFIKCQRDGIVHQYSVDPELLDSHVILVASNDSGEFLAEEEVFCVDQFLLNDGPFSGEDARDLSREALVWWDQQLKEIEGAGT